MKWIFFFFFSLAGMISHAQLTKPDDKNIMVIINVKGTDGIAQFNVRVEFKGPGDSTQKIGYTNSRGIVTLFLPINTKQEIFLDGKKITDYQVPNLKYHTTGMTYTWDKIKANNDDIFKEMPDTTYVEPGKDKMQKANSKMVLLSFHFYDYNYKNLDDEKIVIEGKKSKKIIIAKTGKDGKINILLPKGDDYFLHFTYDQYFDTLYYEMDNSIRNTSISIQYLGSKELARIAKEKEERIAAMELMRKEYEEKRKVEREKEMLSEKEYMKVELQTVPHQQYRVFEEVLKRNRNWKNMLIVTDITGSMYPYIASVLLWYKLNYLNHPLLNMVLFNDGDGISDQLKVIGNTRGIYGTKNISYEKMLDFMIDVALKGNGGDGPENDIEALLFARKNYSDKNEIILVADNYSNIKDISLMSKLNIPVRVILCGTDDFVNTEYLNLAYKTGGTVHTINEDITQLIHVGEGKSIVIAGKKYLLQKGKFIPIKSS